MKRVYIHYLEWEDFKAGMWGTTQDQAMLQKAIQFTGNATLYGEWMAKVVKAWPRTMLHNLTNPSVNKRAFVGHCAVCLAIGCPESITRQAWKLLTDEQRIAADKVAQDVINNWVYERKNYQLYKNVGAKMLP